MIVLALSSLWSSLSSLTFPPLNKQLHRPPISLWLNSWFTFKLQPLSVHSSTVCGLSSRLNSGLTGNKLQSTGLPSSCWSYQLPQSSFLPSSITRTGSDCIIIASMQAAEDITRKSGRKKRRNLCFIQWSQQHKHKHKN